MFESIRENLHVFYSPNYGSNAYVLIGKEIVLIDTSSPDNAEQLLSGLNALGIKPENVSLVLFTHGHADHTGSSHLFPKAEKRMHPHDAERIALKDSGFTCPAALGETSFPKISSGFTEGELINLKPFSLKVLFTPGHTRCSVCFHDERHSLLFSGDTLFQGGCGRTDLPSGSGAELVSSLKKLAKLQYSLLLPGHGLILKENVQENASQVLKTLNRQYI